MAMAIKLAAFAQLRAQNGVAHPALSQLCLGSFRDPGIHADRFASGLFDADVSS
jgi:hypothetical protein